MRTFSVICGILSVCLTSCYTTTYIGDHLVPTNDIDVFYAAKDVKKDYKVIGHISSDMGNFGEKSKQLIVRRAKAVGADAVIILATEYTGGKDPSPYNKAEAIKYSN